MEKTKLPLYKFLLQKAYFDMGFSLMNYIKYPLALIGISSAVNHVSIFWIVFWAFAFGIFCWGLGRAVYHYHLIDTMIEIQNKFNPFCREVRQKIGIPNK